MSLTRLQELITSGSLRNDALYALGLCLACLIAFVVVKRWLLRAVQAAFERTQNTWDDALYRRGVFHTAAYLAPAIVLYYGIARFPSALPLVHKVVVVYVVLNIVVLVRKLLSSGLDIYNSYEIAKKRPLKGYFQVLTLLAYIVGGVITVSLLLDQSPWGLLGGMGALTAVLLLIFRDTILSFIASIQLAFNDMVRVGDWIEMPKYGADGDVIDMALHTIKVQNWDRTIVTIPTYKLIEDSFKNWRGMSESGGRRIMRSLLLDQSSIRFLNDDDIERLGKIEILKPYVDEKRAEVKRHNEEMNIDPSVPVNGRRMTNVGTFRAYVRAYLRQHPRVKHDAIMMVRQLEPTAQGLPLQVYVFANTTVWIEYEGVQGDIFDHLLAAVPQFGLRVYQAPSGNDVSLVTGALTDGGREGLNAGLQRDKRPMASVPPPG